MNTTNHLIAVRDDEEHSRLYHVITTNQERERMVSGLFCFQKLMMIITYINLKTKINQKPTVLVLFLLPGIRT